MNNISLCFRFTKSPPSPFVLLGFCWGLLSFLGRIHILLWLFFFFFSPKFNSQTEKANSKRKLSFWRDLSLISPLHPHHACPGELPVLLPPASLRETEQPLPANSELQLLGTDFAVGKWLCGSAGCRTDRCHAAAKSS